MSVSGKIKSWGIKFTVFGGLQFMVLTIIAMLVFPGGTIGNHDAEQYLFLENFFSDLGRTHDFHGNANYLSMTLFTIALSVLGFSIVSLFLTIPSIFSGIKKNKILSVVMSIVGVLAGICFVGVAFTPCNVFFSEHIFFVRIGFRLLLLACVLLGVNIYRTPHFPNIYAHIIFVISIILFSYILLLTLGPSPRESREGLMIQVGGQKVIVYLLISGIVILAYGAEKVRSHLKL